MGAVKARWLWQNFAHFSSSLIAASSEELAFPQEWLLDPLSSKRWRSKSGWTVAEDINDILEFTELAGVLSIILTPGNYPLGSDLATEIETKMNAIAVTNTYTVVYNVTTNKFEFSATGTFALNWDTGPGKLFSVGKDLGFDVSADDTGLSAYIGDKLTFQSRHFLILLLSQPFEVRAAVLMDTNISSTASVSLGGNATNIWTNPTFVTPLVEGDNMWTNQFGPELFQYWQIAIDDVENPNGFCEAGVLHIGSYTQPERGYGIDYSEGRDELSSIQTADQGAHFQNIRPTRRTWSIEWPGLSGVDKIEYEKVANHVRAGRPFFFALDANDVTNVVYVMLDSGMDFDSKTNDNWSVGFDLLEVLG